MLVPVQAHAYKCQKYARIRACECANIQNRKNVPGVDSIEFLSVGTRIIMVDEEIHMHAHSAELTSFTEVAEIK